MEAASRSAAVQELGVALKGTLAAVRRLRGREAHRPGELSHAQYLLLHELLGSGELASGELAARAELSPATVTQMLDQLAGAGLVERTRSQADRRIVVSHVTEAGRLACEERHARIEPLWTAALERFSAAELRAAAGVLGALHEMFDGLDAPP